MDSKLVLKGSQGMKNLQWMKCDTNEEDWEKDGCSDDERDMRETLGEGKGRHRVLEAIPLSLLDEL